MNMNTSSSKNIILFLLYIPLGVIAGSIIFPLLTSRGVGGGGAEGLLPFVMIFPSLVVFIFTAIIHIFVKKFLPTGREGFYFFIIWLVMIFIVMNDMGIDFMYGTLPSVFDI